MDGSAAYWYGVANPEEIAGMMGKEILQAIIDSRLPHPPISQTLSFWLVEIGDGFAAFEGEPGDHLLNPMGTTHGGWAMTLIDSATGCAGYSRMPAGAGFRTVETKVNLSTTDHQRYRARQGRSTCRVADPPDHLDGSSADIAGRSGARPRHLDLDGRPKGKMTGAK